MSNRLANSKSSYLKKGADELIDWYPWSDEAFERAHREDKPILLSIGAVWCHWCHVMARESWHDQKIASYINDHFIAIKVDRDERPDIDKTYQEAVSALTGQGGWPLTVFITPDKEPFYGGTYFPDRARHGIPAFIDVLTAISDIYKKDRGSINRTINQLMQGYVYVIPKRTKVDPAYLDTVFQEIRSSYDEANGGFGTMPKFPHPETLLFLLQRYETSGGPEAWDIIDNTLKKMAMGGIYDQAGGGFHRYSTDAHWRVPHFEKMLNENALLLRAYIEAYQRSESEFFRQVALETIDFIFRDLAREPAGFSSSIDADLHGEEGAYFTWTADEIDRILGDMSKEFSFAYNVLEDGNFEVPGKNVLFVDREEDREMFADERKRLLEARNKREMPYVDRNIHTSWTALMVTSLVYAFNVLDDRRSLDYAVKTADFIMDSMYKDGTLYRSYLDSPRVDGFFEDYTCMIEALLELYNTTQDDRYLEDAVKLTRDCEEKFYDKDHGGYFFVQGKDRTAMNQDKPLMDFSVPGSNPQMAINLIKLRYYTDNEDYLGRAEELLEGFFDLATQYPLGHSTYYRALDYYFNRPDQIVVVADRTRGLELIDLINSRISKRIVMLNTGRRPYPVFEGKSQIEGKPTVYFCKEGRCTVPLNDPEDIKELLKRPMFGK